jgi:hypothetical protein
MWRLKLMLPTNLPDDFEKASIIKITLNFSLQYEARFALSLPPHSGYNHVNNQCVQDKDNRCDCPMA